MDPFRDELAAAHATIARLEAEITELRAKRDRPRTKVPWANPMLGLVVLAVMVGVIGLIMIGGTILHKSAPDRSFRGVALAPHDTIPPVADPGNVAEKHAPPLDSSKPYVVNKCNCQPGDPLCSCL